jgi:hypothetical protein
MEWRKHPVLKAPTAEEMAQMEPKQLVEPTAHFELKY